MEISDVVLLEEDEPTIKEKLEELFESNSDPFVSIFLGRAYQNMFIGEIRGINEIKEVLKETSDSEAQFWAAIHMVELDIIDEPKITSVLELASKNKEYGPEKRKLAESFLNIIRLKRKLEDRESISPPSITPTTKVNEKYKKLTD